jgi:single-strand DNA-binding protein
MDQGSAVVVGRLASDPKFFGEGDKQRALFSIAFNRGTGDKRKSNFIDCIAWGKRADIMRDYSKGEGIFVTGDLEQDSYTNKDGKKINKIQISVTSITGTRSTRKQNAPSGSTEEVTVGADNEEEIPF